ncbi:hypothetical protein K2173_015422 [Erythroxylum novogranatense]|uniref:Uncharacterized protein n=1 Tax=Erythroxylum novogranatense TaxID=1862640 RepID=A0AAV8SSA3_9ROSI|nr:hypothetical protein K2173_015422 [Erythroxylum novogranatense]
MASETEPAKLLLPYLQRADELQKHEPLVAYYCRLYAMEKGLRIPQNERTKTTNALLVSLMNQLEKDKKSLKLGPEDNLYLEGFSLNVFEKADKQDRAGRGDLNTAKTFYAASIFFEIINQFGALQPDLEQKQKYAVWKAADIRKALKEGRKPNPGPPSGDGDFSNISSDGYDIEPSEANVPHVQSDPSTQFNDQVNDQRPTKNSQSHQLHENVNDQYPDHIPPSEQFHDTVKNHFPDASYPSRDFHPPPQASRQETSTYSQPFQHQPYSQNPQQHLPHHYPSHETSSYSYPNFQSYPSFTESSLPSAPTHYPSYYQGSDTFYITQSAPTMTNYTSTPQYTSNSVADPTPSAAQTYQHDSNYQPPPEKVSEAHKAARFAVGALAFDDVSVAVDYLRKSLELLMNPSAGN